MNIIMNIIVIFIFIVIIIKDKIYTTILYCTK